MTRSERERNNKKKQFHSYYDYSLMFLTLFLCGFGLVMIFSTSSYYADIHFGTSTYFLKKQAFAVALGIFAMVIVSKIDYRIFLKKLPVIHMKPVTALYFLCIALQVFVLFFGAEVNGAKRWIYIGPLNLQPSEISKVGTILFVAYIVQMAPRKVDHFMGFLRIAIYMSPLILCIAKENLSTAIIISGIMVSIVFVASRKKGYFILVGIILLVLGGLFVYFESYRMTRFVVWRNVETHALGYQILQGLYAIASGGIFGVGLGQSMQKLGFIPESHNDMIFSIICEELGLFGAITVIFIFILLLWRLFIVAISAPDLFGGLIAVGILAHVAIQVVINIAVVTNSIPSTGIPLPFISYGGTSITILLAEMGIALSVSNQIRYER